MRRRRNTRRSTGRALKHNASSAKLKRTWPHTAALLATRRRRQRAQASQPPRSARGAVRLTAEHEPAHWLALDDAQLRESVQLVLAHRARDTLQANALLHEMREERVRVRVRVRRGGGGRLRRLIGLPRERVVVDQRLLRRVRVPLKPDWWRRSRRRASTGVAGDVVDVRRDGSAPARANQRSALET